MNPTLNAEVVAEAYENDPARAAAEFGGEFRDDIAAFVTREAVEACIVVDRFKLPMISTNRYYAYTDPSGGSADSWTLAISHAEKDGTTVLDLVRETRPPFSPQAVVEDYAAVLKTYGIHRVTGDRYAGEFPRELFRNLGISYDLSERSASDAYRDFLPKVNNRKVELLDLPRLTKQFCDLERKTSRNGKDSISHPPGGHDDLANSATGALLMAATVRGPTRIHASVLEATSRPDPTRFGWR
jgi:hypothetical protein